MLGRDTTTPMTDLTQAESQPGDSMPLLDIVGNTATLEGKFDIADSIRIECEVGGEITVGQRLVIGQNGAVKADVHTVDAVIMGHYEGNLVASGNVEIAATGHVTGTIVTDSLVISKGAFFSGTVSRIQAEAQPQRPPRLLAAVR
jgi:cytoskeletal protein CcmA (bactofilin family)